MILLFLLFGCLGSAALVLNVNVFTGRAALLSCSQEVDIWILPNLTTIRDVGDGTSRFQLLPNGSLSIENSSSSDSGVYLCVLKSSEAEKVQLLVDDHPLEFHEWPRHRDGVIRGLIAAGSVVLVFGFFCLVYKFRWKPNEKEKLMDQRGGDSSAASTSYYNAGLEVEHVSTPEAIKRQISIDRQSDEQSSRF